MRMSTLIKKLSSYPPGTEVSVAHPSFTVAHEREDCDGYCGVSGECAYAEPSAAIIETHRDIVVDEIEVHGERQVLIRYGE